MNHFKFSIARLAALIALPFILSTSKAQQVMPTITASATIDYYFYYPRKPIDPPSLPTVVAMAANMQKQLRLADVCNIPVSAESKRSTAETEELYRWIAAQEVFNYLVLTDLLPAYLNATTALSFVMDGTKYQGFQVTYSDGSVERWGIFPGYRTSGIKLIDRPMPSSLRKPTNGVRSGCAA